MCPRLLSWASRHRLGPEAGPLHTGRAANHGIDQESVWETSHELYDHLIHWQRGSGGPEPKQFSGGFGWKPTKPPAGVWRPLLCFQ